MASQDNFQVAAHRHFQDAEYLITGNRLANAGQLFGLAAECGIKAVLVEGLGHQNPGVHLTEGRRNRASLLDQANLQWLDDLSNIQGRVSAGYLAYICNIGKFANWSVEQRYWNDVALPDSLSDWQLAATEVMRMLQQAQMDGIGSLRL
jgi:hypothetical protein